MLPIKLQKGLFIGEFPLSQLFGENPEAYAVFGLKGHNGIDYALPTGTPLISCMCGTVIECAYDAGGYGNYLKIENDECGVIYAHMKRLSEYKPGMQVTTGTTIGVSGNTGNSTGSHLHFGVFPKPRDRSNGYAGYIDPLDKSNVTWVDCLDEGNVEVEKLKKKIEELESSLKNWKEEHAKELDRAVDLTKILKDISEIYKMDDFDYKTDRKTLLYKVNQSFAVMTELEDNAIDFSLLGKHIRILITPVEEVSKREVKNN